MEYELGVIGAGNMAEAIVRAAVESGIIKPQQVIVSDPSAERRELFENIGCVSTDTNADVIASASQIMLAVKPQMFAKVVDDLKQIDSERQIIISIMAGLTSQRITQMAGKSLRIVRVMPNTPLLAGLGMSGISLGQGAHEGDELLAIQVFKSAGEAVVLDESDIDAVTAVSGSGPAYVFYLAEAMTDAAKSLGLNDETAALLARQTILGAATLMKTSNLPPAELRRRVTSPGGTTQAAIEHMESTQVRQHIIDAIRRAAERSRELGR